MNLLATPRPRNEELNPQHVPPFRHREYRRHPRPYPLQVLRGADYPDEDYAAHGGGGGSVGRDERAQGGDVRCYADAAGEEQYCAVGG